MTSSELVANEVNYLQRSDSIETNYKYLLGERNLPEAHKIDRKQAIK